MKKNRFLLLAGIIGFTFMASSCSSGGGGMMMKRAKEPEIVEVTHNEDFLAIQEPHFAEEAPTSEKKTAAPARQWEDKDTGFVVFGVLMGVSACLIATMVTLSILKKKKGNEVKEEEQ